jgi:hypothetical protein
MYAVLHTIRVENFGGEANFGRLVWVLVAESNAQAEDAAFPRGV